MQEHQDYGHASRAASVAGAMMPRAGVLSKEEGAAGAKSRSQMGQPGGPASRSWWEVTAGTWGRGCSVSAQPRGLELLRQSWVNWGK